MNNCNTVHYHRNIMIPFLALQGILRILPDSVEAYGGQRFPETSEESF